MKSPCVVAGLLLAVALGSSYALSGARAEDEAAAAQPPLRHVVLFKFKEGTTEADVASLEKAFAALPGKIDVIQSLEWGTNISPEPHSQGYTHCFFLTFADAAARDAYLPHPAHKEFGGMLGPHLEKVLVVDYVAK